MPNWKVHLNVARKINEKTKFCDLNYNAFLFGNIAPDINNGYIVKDISKIISHDYTHYSNGKGNLNYILFINEYNDRILNNPILLGYLCHIATDYFWNKYFYEKAQKENLLSRYNKEEIRLYKQREFRIFDNNFYFETYFDSKELCNLSQIINRIEIESNDIEKINNFLQIRDDNYAIENYILYTKEEMEKVLDDNIRFLFEIISSLEENKKN